MGDASLSNYWRSEIMKSFNWDKVIANIVNDEVDLKLILKDGQFESLLKIAKSLSKTGIILADEVGLGKTFIAIALVDQITKEGGTCAIVVPPGLVRQWDDEIKKYYKIANSKKIICHPISPVRLTGFNDLLFSKDLLNSENNECLIMPYKRPLAIFSHNFNTTRISSKSRVDSIHFPTLFWGKINETSGEKNIVNYWKKYKKDYLEGFYETDVTYRIIECAANANIKLSIEEKKFLKNDDFRLIQYKDEYAKKSNIIKEFYKGELGDKITKKIIGSAIGNFDLVIIDEAHKSKDDSEDPTILSTLLNEIININCDKNLTRTLGLTATPVEMHVSQWEFILKRIGCSGNSGDILLTIASFANSLQSATKNPDSVNHLNSLISDSMQFQNVLLPYITRRRKVQLESFNSLVQYSDSIHSSHPNRKYNLESIKLDTLSRKWKNNIFAMEAISQASKGLKIDYKVKNIDKMYASGLIKLEALNSLDSDTNSLSPSDVAKLKRIEKWSKFLGEFNNDDLNNDFDLYDHPRIRKTAEHIEKYLLNLKDDYLNEKILVFGTFIKPLKILRNLLNNRYVLRQVDHGLPVRVSLENQKELESLFREYELITTNLNSSSFVFCGVLKQSLTFDQFKEIIEKSTKEYLKVSRFVSEFFKEFEAETKTQFYKKLSHFQVIEIIEQKKKLLMFYDYLENLVLSNILIDYDTYKVFVDNAKKRKESIEEIIINSWENLYSSMSEIDSDLKDEEYSVKANLVANRLLDIFTEEANLSGFHRSNFCRQMDGSTPMETRRILQGQFNNSRAMPRVLIAQSMVGREGLNLHTCCKKVVIFHPEWNPAVLEQQIGRVDRIDSLWEKKAKEFLETTDLSTSEFPKIEIDFIVFEGTYDEYMFNVMNLRRNNLNAQLFGALLGEEALNKVPHEYREKLKDSAPDFSPIHKNRNKKG